VPQRAELLAPDQQASPNGFPPDWVVSMTLQRTVEIESPSETDAPTTAFCLAGGGTKTYMIDEKGLVPDVITATSAGAILGAVLAQARTLDEFRARTADLIADLLAMTHVDQLFGRQPWIAALDKTPFGGAIEDFVVGRTRPPVPGNDADLLAGFEESPKRRRKRRLWRWSAILRAAPSLPKVRRGLRAHHDSLMTLEPLGAALRQGGPSGLRAIDPQLIARPGLRLRLAVAALGAGELRYVTEEGVLVAADARTPITDQPVSVDLIEGVLSSASVPLLFPPRRLDNEMYVDGGVLTNIPVDAAVNLGARRIVAVLAVPLTPSAEIADYTDANLVGVFMRAVGDIPFIARQRADLAAALPQGTTLTVIDPLVDLVGPFEVAQGLLLIDMDYGWLRAADILADLDDETRALGFAATEQIVIARAQAWHLEERCWKLTGVANDVLATLRSLKTAVGTAIEDRKKLGLEVPAGAETWSNDYERHNAARPSWLPASAGEPRAPG
jgi:NTE family protein